MCNDETVRRYDKYAVIIMRRKYDAFMTAPAPVLVMSNKALQSYKNKIPVFTFMLSWWWTWTHFWTIKKKNKLQYSNISPDGQLFSRPGIQKQTQVLLKFSTAAQDTRPFFKIAALMVIKLCC